MALSSRIEKGTLALVGSGEYLPGMEGVDSMLLERVSGEPNVVCLPTAAGKESDESIERWSKMGAEHFARIGAQVESVKIINRETAMDESLAGKIEAANFVYLSGGGPYYLYDTLVGTKAWEAILGVLEKGGVVAGCSAGAMIWGERMPGFFPPPLPWKRGFNGIPGVSIVPHNDELPSFLPRLFRSINITRPTLVGVDGYTALVAHEGEFSVLGKGGVTVWNGLRRTHFTQGQEIALP